ncbi:MAG TPA: nucleotide exchange factor GrpE [Candidatus Limnocylindrales bacterium]
MTHPHRTRAQERIDQLDASPAALAAEAERLRGEIDRLTGELREATARTEEYLGALQRERAEFQNYKRRASEDRERDLGLASESLLRKVLALADDFDRALEAMPAELADQGWIEGIVAIDRKLRQTLESEGLAPIEAVGRPFDPREHEAVANVPGTGRPDGEVVAELRRGYRLRERVLRPAMVAVAQGGEAGSRPDPRQSTNTTNTTNTNTDSHEEGSH